MPVQDIYAGEASFRPPTTTPSMVGYYGGGGGADPMQEALSEYQKVMGPKTAPHPLENYLGGVDDAESYRTAMMQYVSNGGKRPRWYTGNYEMDKGNLDVAVNATMTPMQQEQRAEAQERIAATKEQRNATRALREKEGLAKDRENALKREDKGKALALKTIAGPKQQEDAMKALETRLGIDLFDAMPVEQRTAVARQVSNAAKRRLATEGTEADYNNLMEEEMDKAIASGQLKLGKENPWFMPDEKPSFRAAPEAGAPKGTPATTAPAKAIEYLKAHPEAKDQFKAKFGYLP